MAHVQNLVEAECKLVPGPATILPRRMEEMTVAIWGQVLLPENATLKDAQVRRNSAVLYFTCFTLSFLLTVITFFIPGLAKRLNYNVRPNGSLNLVINGLARLVSFRICGEWKQMFGFF